MKRLIDVPGSLERPCHPMIRFVPVCRDSVAALSGLALIFPAPLAPLPAGFRLLRS
jgi:hypothetical protein